MAKDYVMGDKVYVVRKLTQSQGRAKKGAIPPRIKHAPIYEAYGLCEVVGEVRVGGTMAYKLHNRSRLHTADEMYRKRADAERAARKLQAGE